MSANRQPGSGLQARQAGSALVALVDALPAMIAYWDKTLHCRFANRAYELWLGVSLEEVIGKHAREVLGPIYEMNLPHIEGVLRGQEQAFEEEIPGRNGGPSRYVQLRYVPDVVDGVVEGFSVLVVDITDRRRAELALARKEQGLRDAQRLARVGHWSWDPATDTTEWSEELYRIYDRDPGLPAPSYQDLAPYHQPEAFARLGGLVQRALETGEPYEAETWFRRRDGTVVWVLGRGEAVRDANGKIIGLRGSTLDITHRKKLEEQVLQLQKLESIGRLAGGVAHDFNNQLTVIHADISSALLSTRDPHVTESLQSAMAAVHRSTELTRSLLAFARRQPTVPRALDLNAEIGGALAMLRRLVGASIELSWKPGAEISKVLLDPMQVHQLLTNLVVNARDAIVKGGTVTIATANAVLDERFCSSIPNLPPGDYVLLTVRDTGSGMTGEIRERIFEPFFTTKDPGKGTGLGLPIVHGIVTQNGGHIVAESEPGAGATFRLWFPRFRNDATTGPLLEQGAGTR